MGRRPPTSLALATVALAALAGAAVAVRRRLEEIDPLPDVSGASVPLDVPLRRPLGQSGDARMLPPTWEPAALSALARWEPPALRHPLARAAGYAWAAPLTLAGLLAGAVSGARPRLRDGAIVFANARGPAGAVLRNRRYKAGAVGHVVISLDEPGPRLLAHELVHVRHAERLGPLSALLYLALLSVYGYARHPLERAARRAARRVVDAP